MNDNDEHISNLFVKTGRLQNIIMLGILTGFVVFGKEFIVLWAGADYVNSYYMTLAFFVALYIPLIQNLGITILQARNQMKFRSLLYIIIACFALIAEIVFAKMWGGIGCAIAIAGALLLGQGLIMNIYYKRVQKIDISGFWIEIIKMNIAPILLSIIAYFLFNHALMCDTWFKLVMSILIYGLFYIGSCCFFSLNKEEKSLLLGPFKRIVTK